jgi:hypothetical protein
LGEYHSDDEIETSDNKTLIGGGNVSPEVLKMLHQMAPASQASKEEEPDEIKVYNRFKIFN